jgi:hypothetical protein
MISISTKKYLLATAWLLVLIFFVISLIGVIYSPLAEWSAKIANRNYNGEGIIETIEALCWIAAALIYAKTTSMIFKSDLDRLPKLSHIFFIAFCFIAFGEEISWGQHVFNFDVSEQLKTINQQKELNVHNLNLSQIFGLSKDNFAYRYLKNFTTILNPLFYLICVLLWVVFPLLKKNMLGKNRFLSALPEPALGTIIFCGINALIYLVIDKLFFDVGEIFELSLALTAIMSAVDAYLRVNAQGLFPQLVSKRTVS